MSVAIAKGLRGQVWVRAEISVLKPRGNSCYVTLAEPARDAAEADATLDVVIWRSAWARIQSQLEERGLTLREEMTVSLKGDVCLRPGTGRLQLQCSALDTDALLGDLAARRMALQRALATEGLFAANGRRPLGPLPLRIGLVASHQSQGYRDFRDVLTTSGYAFVLVERPVAVQGLGAPAAVSAAVVSLGSAGVDVIVVVRGGGARADLDAFDSELVVRAVAGAPVPVWTGVGHTGDRCLADEAAAAAFATPTACAQALVARIADVDAALAQRVARLRELAHRSDRAADELLHRRRLTLSRSATAQLARHGDSVARRAGDLRHAVGQTVFATRLAVTASAQRLPRLAGLVVDDRARVVRDEASAARRGAHASLDRNEARFGATRQVLQAFDPTRQLARGWTLTLDETGALVRSAAGLRPGQRITSRFVDGDRTSTVDREVAAP